MFTFKEPKIISAAPIAEIKKYLGEIGASEIGASEIGASEIGSCEIDPEKTNKQVYEYAGLEIEIVVFKDKMLPNLGLEKHTISVRGDKEKADEFLNAFVYRFLSIGG